MTIYCLPKGRLSEEPHEIQGCCSQKCSGGGVGHARVGWVMDGVGQGRVGHRGVGWVGHEELGCGGSCRGEVGWLN